MVLGHFEEQIPFLKEKWEKKKKGEKLGFARRSGLGWLCFSFLASKGPNNIQEEI